MNIQKRETLFRVARIGLVIVMLCSLFAAFPASPVKAESYKIIVDLNGSGEYTSIMAAVVNAKPNTVIYVRTGEYAEEINLAQMGIWESGPGNLAIVSMDGIGKAKLHGNSGMPTIHDNNQPFPGALWIDGMTIDSGVSSAISLTNFNGLMLTNVTIENSGNPEVGATLTDAISLRANSGNRTVALFNTNIYNFVRDGLDVQVSGSAKVNVVIEEGSFKSLSSEYASQKAVDINATGTSTVQFTVYKTVFDSLYNSAISALAESATPVTLTTHVFSGTMTNVAKTPGTNAIEIRARGAGAHVVNSWFYSNNISLSSLSDGIELEPAAPGTFNSVLRYNIIGNIIGASLDRGIVIDNGTTGKAAATANFKLDTNTVNNAMGSGLDLHMSTQNAASWNGLISNNTFNAVNKDTTTDQEAIHFKIQNAGGVPTFTMSFTLNKLYQTAGLSNTIKLENVVGGASTFRVVSAGSSSEQEIIDQNPTILPKIYGTVPTIRNFPGSNVENIRPKTVPDLLVTRASQPRSANVVENDIDSNGKYLVYVNPLGEKGGSFNLDTMGTPETQLDDLLVYQVQSGYLGDDKGYYVMQDTLGCLSIGYVTTKIGEPFFVPMVRR